MSSVFTYLLTVLCLALASSVAGAQSFVTPFGAVTIELSDVDVVHGDLRAAADAIHSQHGARVLSYDSQKGIQDLSHADGSVPLSENDRLEFTRQLRTELEKLGSTKLVGLTLQPYDPFAQVLLPRPVPSEAIIILLEHEAHVLRHELLHVLVAKASPRRELFWEGRRVSYLEYQAFNEKKLLRELDAAAELAVEKRSSESIAAWLGQAAAYDKQRVLRATTTIVEELDVIGMEIMHREQWKLGDEQLHSRLRYLEQQMDLLTRMREYVYKAGPYQTSLRDELNPKDAQAVDEKMRELEGALQSAEKLAKKVEAFYQR